MSFQVQNLSAVPKNGDNWRSHGRSESFYGDPRSGQFLGWGFFRVSIYNCKRNVRIFCPHSSPGIIWPSLSSDYERRLSLTLENNSQDNELEGTTLQMEDLKFVLNFMNHPIYRVEGEISAILLTVVGDGWKEKKIIYNMGSKLDSFLRKRCFLVCFVHVVLLRENAKNIHQYKGVILFSKIF